MQLDPPALPDHPARHRNLENRRPPRRRGEPTAGCGLGARAAQTGQKRQPLHGEHLADEDETKRGKRFTKTAGKALTELWNCIKDPARSWPMSDGLRCSLMDVWEQSCIAPGVICDCQNQSDRRKKFNAARKELEAAGALIRDGASRERVYPAPKVKSDDCDEAGR